jgi:hypothetical protein
MLAVEVSSSFVRQVGRVEWKVSRTGLALVVLECFEAGEGGSSGYDLVAEAGLVLLLVEVVVFVDLLVGILRFSCYILSVDNTQCSSNEPKDCKLSTEKDTQAIGKDCSSSRRMNLPQPQGILAI